MHTLEPSGQVVGVMNEGVATQISQSVRKGNYSDVAMVPMFVLKFVHAVRALWKFIFNNKGTLEAGDMIQDLSAQNHLMMNWIDL